MRSSPTRERGIGGVEGVFERGIEDGGARLVVQADEVIEPMLGVAVERSAVIEQNRGDVRATIGISRHAAELPGVVRTGN